MATIMDISRLERMASTFDHGKVGVTLVFGSTDKYLTLSELTSLFFSLEYLADAAHIEHETFVINDDGGLERIDLDGAS